MYGLLQALNQIIEKVEKYNTPLITYIKLQIPPLYYKIPKISKNRVKIHNN